MMESITKLNAQTGNTPIALNDSSPTEVQDPESPTMSVKMDNKKLHPKPKITDFEIDKIIGIGHFGKVQKAWNKKS